MLTMTHRPPFLVAMLSGALLTAAHFYAADRPLASGVVLILDHMFNVGLAAVMLVFCSVVGDMILRVGRLDGASALESVVLSIPIGYGVLGTIVLALGGMSALRPAFLLAAFAGTAILARRDIVGWLPRFRNAVSEAVAEAGKPTMFLSMLVVSMMLVLALTPPADYDSYMYHLRIPQQFLDAGRVFVPEDNLHVSYVGLAHMFYIPLLAMDAPSAVTVMNVGLAFIAAITVLLTGTRYFSRTAGRLAFALFWGSGIIVLTAFTAKVDVILAYFLLVGHFAVLRATRDTQQTTRWLVLAALVLGFAVGVKHLAVLYIVALVPIVLVLGARAPSLRRGLQLTAVPALALLAAALPWLLKNSFLLGAPFYPEFADRMLVPWLAELYGSNTIPAAIERTTLQGLGAVREAFSLKAWFLTPERLTPEGEGTAYGANLAFLALPLVIFMWRERAFILIIGPAIGFLLLLLAHNPYLNLRYLIPALAPLTLGAAAVFAWIVGYPQISRIRLLLISGIVAVVLAAPVRAITDRVVGSSALDYAFGRQTRAEFLADSRNSEVAGYSRMVIAVNELTTPRDRVLLLFEGRGYGFESQVLQDNVLTNWPLIVPLISDGCLERSGITHVLVSYGVLNYFARRGLDPSGIGWDHFDAFARRCLIASGSGPGWRLYSLQGAS